MRDKFSSSESSKKQSFDQMKYTDSAKNIIVKSTVPKPIFVPSETNPLQLNNNQKKAKRKNSDHKVYTQEEDSQAHEELPVRERRAKNSDLELSNRIMAPDNDVDSFTDPKFIQPNLSDNMSQKDSSRKHQAQNETIIDAMKPMFYFNSRV